ncbi:DUF362 domain-containing protein [Thermodesulfobacteriota bacterium]
MKNIKKNDINLIRGIQMSRVALLKTENRRKGVKKTLDVLGVNPVKGKDILIKPNFNTADPAPGSTHNDTLLALVDQVWAMGARSISLGERSYPPTREVMKHKGIVPLLKQKEVKVIDFDDLDDQDWVLFRPGQSHWSNGFRIARPVLEAECLISTGCLKTHQFGGIFTMSLKLHVGVVPTDRHGYQYMAELHQSPHQQEMIAEINEPFAPDLILLDGIDVFVDGGPMTGKRAKGNVLIAASDRVAADAVGVAILKLLGGNNAIMNRSIFDQAQIARAVELGLGVAAPQAIDVVAAGPESQDYREKVLSILLQG